MGYAKPAASVLREAYFADTLLGHAPAFGNMTIGLTQQGVVDLGT